MPRAPRLPSLAFFALAALLLGFGAARADDPPTFRLLLQGNRFEPAEVRVPANKRFNLVVRNADPAVAEFESVELRVERIITAGRETTLRLGPLAPGRYPFMDEFHADTAQGVLIAE